MANHEQSNPRPEQRCAARFKTAMGITLRQRGCRQVPATLTSMSRLGCTVVGSTISKGGDLVWVKFPGLESQAADVRWSNDNGAGLAFRYPLHDAVSDHLRTKSLRSLNRESGGNGFKLPC